MARSILFAALASVTAMLALSTGMAAWADDGQAESLLGRAIPEDAAAVSFDGAVYVSLETVARLMDGSAELDAAGRSVVLGPEQRRWQFVNGGDRVQTPDGKEHVLERLLLVIDGRHFAPLEECAPLLKYKVDSGPPLRLVRGERSVELEPVSVDSPYRAHRVERLEVVHEVLTTTADLEVRPSLHDFDKAEALPAGTTLLVRRHVVVDGTPSAIVTDCATGLQSYLVPLDALRDATRPGRLEGTAWAKSMGLLREQSDASAALRSSRGPAGEKSVAVTVDLCWSLRPYERKFFSSLSELAQAGEQTYNATLFVSGRWLEQHPTEMQALIELGRQENVGITWGLHSWAHPKSGGFMNDFTAEELRADTLRLERDMLQWGIVPTVFYRFPGLIHDGPRLVEILGMDLLAIDCNTWMALVRPDRPEPFYHPVAGGGIILIHGNGNEPRGIRAFDAWLRSDPDWKWRPLAEFLPAD